jgi:hypothetical protein
MHLEMRITREGLKVKPMTLRGRVKVCTQDVKWV